MTFFTPFMYERNRFRISDDLHKFALIVKDLRRFEGAFTKTRK